jgi:hypothetical protein
MRFAIHISLSPRWLVTLVLGLTALALLGAG